MVVPDEVIFLWVQAAQLPLLVIVQLYVLAVPLHQQDMVMGELVVLASCAGYDVAHHLPALLRLVSLCCGGCRLTVLHPHGALLDVLDFVRSDLQGLQAQQGQVREFREVNALFGFVEVQVRM